MIEESDNEAEANDEDQVPESNKDDIDQYRQQLENEISFSESKSSKSGDDSIRRYIESCSQYLGNLKIGPEVEYPENFVKTAENQEPFPIGQIKTQMPETTSLHLIKEKEELSSNQADQIELDGQSISSNELETDNLPELANLDPNSRMYRLKMVEKLLSDTRSQRSYSTTASTIAPSVITDRIRKNIDKKEKMDIRKRCVAKGEASAVHRHRKENKDVVKEYAGWDF